MPNDDRLFSQLESYRRLLELLKRQRQLYIGDIPPQVNRDIETLEERIKEIHLQLDDV